jgi:hypothetical protein
MQLYRGNWAGVVKRLNTLATTDDFERWFLYNG